MSEFVVYIQADLRYGAMLLDEVKGESVVERTVRLAKQLKSNKIVCGIYNIAENIPLAEQLKEQGVDVILSDEENVTKRMLDVVENEREHVVRITGDQCLLDVELTQQIMHEYAKHNCEFFREESPTNSVVPDIVSTETLHKYHDEISVSTRYFDVLRNKKDVSRLKMLLPTLMYNFKANSYDGYRTCKSVISEGYDIYDLNIKCLNWLNGPRSDLREKGMLSSWILPYWDNFFEDNSGKNNPWWTLAAADFLTPRLDKGMAVFEWGCGNSTLYFSQYVDRVISVEHNPEWHKKMSGICPKNAQIDLHEDVENGEYCNAILSYGRKFDIILVDGADRNNCMKNAVKMLNATGVLIVDNADCDYTAEGSRYLKDNGFRTLEFGGAMYGACGEPNITKLFYRDENCLKI